MAGDRFARDRAAEKGMSRQGAVVLATGAVAVVVVALAVQLLVRAHLRKQTKREQATLLRSGVKAWNEWRKRNPGVAIDLSGVDLARRNLDSADLRCVDLASANLAHADLDSAILSGSNLSHANLAGADLERADLTDANLTGSDLSGAALYDAILRRTDLTDANLANLTRMSVHLQAFEQVDLRRAVNVPAGFPDLSRGSAKR